jgi:hypothetical protein
VLVTVACCLLPLLLLLRAAAVAVAVAAVSVFQISQRALFKKVTVQRVYLLPIR